MTDKHNDSIERLLSEGLVKPPDGFTDSVMTKLAAPAGLRAPSQTNTDNGKATLWPSAALAACTALGAYQVIGFIFGLWIPATAG